MGKDSIRFAFVGDVNLTALRAVPMGADPFPAWISIREAIGGHDFLVGNLECSLVDERCSRDMRQRPMAVPSTAASFLRDVGFTDLCLANNHVPDCGPAAIAVAREQLAASNIRAFGAGADLREAENTVIAEHAGHRIAFLGACDYSDYYAGKGRRHGIAPLRASRLGRRVRAAAAQADLVIVTLHADLEFSEAPGRWRQRLSRWLVRQGAHMVIQHHPHVLQGIETYRGGVIAYSLGNFIFPLHRNRYQNRKSGVFDSLVLVVDADLRDTVPKFTTRTVPLRIGKDHFPSRVHGVNCAKEIERIAALSALVSDRGAHRRAWLQRCRHEARTRAMSISYAVGRGHLGRGIHEAFRLLTCREDRRWIVGLLSLGHL